MAIERKAVAKWTGDLKSGQGFLTFGSKAYQGPYSFKGRTSEASSETNPEELVAAALAGCFSMQLSALLTKAGYIPDQIQTTALVNMKMDSHGISIANIVLETQVIVPNMSPEDICKYAEKAKKICPISKALAAVTIEFRCQAN